MKKLCVIPCGKKKIWDLEAHYPQAPAKEVYLSTFHKLCRQYAEQFTDQWVVLSGKHGFLFPDDMVDGPYDVTFGQRNAKVISIERLKQQVIDKQLDHYDELVILTGKKYKPYINGAFDEMMKKTFPLADYKGIGYMQKALKQAIEAKKSLS
ncbi:hypothetical protein JOC34_001146 [Virgibacillus halotolerans]|uniref:DUF6884 domain-containing protein n=1 Tax=Virgibacillus halotolerans TaxID=1071053 RepID=UPI0019617EF7|nr:DUF6884 domain-containing protein [Virgibacillus halotolerans]MBM7598789.1 hypothetical protein [Virgibacillus halotolerans]